MFTTLRDVKNFELVYLGSSTWILGIQLKKNHQNTWAYIGLFHHESEGEAIIDSLKDGSYLKVRKSDGQINYPKDWWVQGVRN